MFSDQKNSIANFDTPITKGLRRHMIENLEQKLRSNPALLGYEKTLEAMATIPRHVFIGKGFEFLAYQNEAIRIEAEQTISQPLTVAIQTTLLDLRGTEKVLEVGTGSGYQASILSLLCHRVYTLERHKVLYTHATEILRKLNCFNVYTHHRDGFEGYSIQAPYQRILVTCAAPNIPEKLIDQLEVGGKIVLPKEDGQGLQDMIRATKLENGELAIEEFGKFMFVPMLNGIEKQNF